MTLRSMRAYVKAEEAMILAMMPRTSANDSAPLTSDILPSRADAHRTWRAGRVDVPALTFKLSEVANG